MSDVHMGYTWGTLWKSRCQRNTSCNAPLSHKCVSAQRPPRMPFPLHKWLERNLHAFSFPDHDDKGRMRLRNRKKQMKEETIRDRRNSFLWVAFKRMTISLVTTRSPLGHYQFSTHSQTCEISTSYLHAYKDWEVWKKRDVIVYKE